MARSPSTWARHGFHLSRHIKWGHLSLMIGTSIALRVGGHTIYSRASSRQTSRPTAHTIKQNLFIFLPPTPAPACPHLPQRDFSLSKYKLACCTLVILTLPPIGTLFTPISVRHYAGLHNAIMS